MCPAAVPDGKERSWSDRISGGERAARRKYARRARERTVAYDGNLPDSLERREPEPASGQPRYGGTGAIGFSPAAVTPPSE